MIYCHQLSTLNQMSARSIFSLNFELNMERAKRVAVARKAPNLFASGLLSIDSISELSFIVSVVLARGVASRSCVGHPAQVGDDWNL